MELHRDRTPTITRPLNYDDVIYARALTLTSDAPSDAADTIVEALRTLKGVVPSIRDFQAGVDRGIMPGNATVAATATFDDDAGYLAYRDHPAHRAVIERYIDPVRESRAAIQFEI